MSLHVNLSPETRHLINAKSLAWMKPTAVLVNTSRGPVVDQAALAEALRDGVIAAAALDVTDPEPIPMDDPLVGMDNCLIVPHIASASRATRGEDGRDGRREPAGWRPRRSAPEPGRRAADLTPARRSAPLGETPSLEIGRDAPTAPESETPESRNRVPEPF